MRRLLDFLWQEWKHLQLQIESLGPLVATAVVSAIGNGSAFHKGREFAAWPFWCRGSGRPEVSPSRWASVSEETRTSERCLSTVPEQRCCASNAKDRVRD